MHWKSRAGALIVVGLLLAGVAPLVHGRGSSTDFSCVSASLHSDHTEVWFTYWFQDPESGDPIMAKLYAEEIQAKNSVLVFRTGRWIEFNRGNEEIGSGLRIRRGTMARIHFHYKDCHEIIEPKDK